MTSAQLDRADGEHDLLAPRRRTDEVAGLEVLQVVAADARRAADDRADHDRGDRAESPRPLPISTSSSSDANRIVQIVMPDTGLFDEPTSPAMYADTEQNTKPATIMMTVIGRLTPRLPTISWYRIASGSVNSTRPIRIALHRQVLLGVRDAPAPRRRASRASPLRMPDSSELRIEISAQTPPTSIAPTPR